MKAPTREELKAEVTRLTRDNRRLQASLSRATREKRNKALWESIEACESDADRIGEELHALLITGSNSESPADCVDALFGVMRRAKRISVVIERALVASEEVTA